MMIAFPLPKIFACISKVEEALMNRTAQRENGGLLLLCELSFPGERISSINRSQCMHTCMSARLEALRGFVLRGRFVIMSEKALNMYTNKQAGNVSRS